jgi:hypothetical protein
VKFAVVMLVSLSIDVSGNFFQCRHTIKVRTAQGEGKESMFSRLGKIAKK